jgi:hypothetical protein
MWIGGGSPAAGSAPRGFHVCVATSANKELDLLELPEGTFLRLGDSAVVKIAGCVLFAYKSIDSGKSSRSGEPSDIEEAVMGVVVPTGRVRHNDHIVAVMPQGDRTPLKPI